MDLLRAMGLSAVLTLSLALVIGSQGTSAGPLAIYAINLDDFRFFWSWPVFLCASGFGWALMLLQR